MRSRSASGLAMPSVLSQREQLAVDVRLRHMVEVDQRQRRDTAARQRFDRPGADAAQPHHCDVRREVRLLEALITA